MSNKGIVLELEENKENIMVNFQRDTDLHDRVMEVKGNIRVFCRARPILPSDIETVNQRLEPNYMPHSIQSKQKVSLLKK